jgi:hypothetical protein
MKSISSDKQLRDYSRVMAIALAALGALLVMRQKSSCFIFWSIGLIFYVIGLVRPRWLSLVYSVWMKFSFVLSWVNTRILLSIIFYIVLAPIGLAMRLFRFDPLDRAINKQKSTYWTPRPQKTFVKSDYERLY